MQMCSTFSSLVLVLIVTTVVRATVPPADNVDAEVAPSKEQVVGLAASSSTSLNDFGVWSKYHKRIGQHTGQMLAFFLFTFLLTLLTFLHKKQKNSRIELRPTNNVPVIFKKKTVNIFFRKKYERSWNNNEVRQKKLFRNNFGHKKLYLINYLNDFHELKLYLFIYSNH